MNKKQMIMIGAVCAVCFALPFGATIFMKTPAAAKAAEPNAPEPNATGLKKPAAPDEMALTQRGISEKQLKLLVQSLRAKISECDKREQELGVREQRVQTAREQLARDINEISSMQVQLANTSAQIKQDKALLEQYQIKIGEDESTNLKKMATVYDKMDSAGAAKILVNMCMNKQIEDAVKILNYMSERTAAKAMSEIAGTDPKIAGDICMGLKRVKESSK
jgi:flagellar motility protein MotE (MotC chaperone)